MCYMYEAGKARRYVLLYLIFFSFIEEERAVIFWVIDRKIIGNYFEKNEIIIMNLLKIFQKPLRYLRNSQSIDI